jgi:hypothetical protein
MLSRPVAMGDRSGCASNPLMEQENIGLFTYSVDKPVEIAFAMGSQALWLAGSLQIAQFFISENLSFENKKISIINACRK